MQIGIYKYTTKSTILDVGFTLNYNKTNKRNEQEYKGSIVFTIHQIQRWVHKLWWINTGKNSKNIHH